MNVKGFSEREKEEVVLVDGYNVIFNVDELKIFVNMSLESARDKLKDDLLAYSEIEGKCVYLVFDGQKTHNKSTVETRERNLTVVFTATNVSADTVIERMAREMTAKSCDVTVVTNDMMEREIALGCGARWNPISWLVAEIKEIKRDYL